MALYKSDAIRVRHMLDACIKTQKFITNKTRVDLDTDEQLSLALVRLIEIIGEAGTKISEEGKAYHTDIMWKEIIGTRNRLIHGYDDVNLDIVWQIVKVDILQLIPQLHNVLEKLEIEDQQKLF